MSGVTAVSAMHEQMHQRAGGEEHEQWQPTQEMRPMLAQKQSHRDGQERQRDEERPRRPEADVRLARFVT